MKRLSAVLIALAGLAACQRDGARTEHPETASAYTADSPGPAGTPQGAALTAPPLIPGMEVQLARLDTAPPRALDSIRTAHKNLVTDLVSAMEADLRRVGLSGDDRFDALGDSVLANLGGGTGVADRLDPEDVPEHQAQVRRLIELYRGLIAGAR